MDLEHAGPRVVLKWIGHVKVCIAVCGRNFAWMIILWGPMVMTAHAAEPATDPTAADAPAAQVRSPWLIAPIISSGPKLGTSLGALGAYLHKFDPVSSVSMFGVGGLYTSTYSKIGAVFARTYFGQDHHRLTAFAGGGQINNDYQDFLGTGFPLATEDRLKAYALRYLYRGYSNWFIGAQGVSTNYQIIATDALGDEFLQAIGLTGFDSVAVGAVIEYDSRDDLNSPSRGLFLDANNLAYRTGLGGSVSFDAYRLKLQGYWPNGAGNVLAVRLLNHWTVDAPAAGYASIQLRGYTTGQYLGQNMSSLEIEERLRFGKRWGGTLYAGVACLYGDGIDGKHRQCDASRNVYASAAAGLYYVLKPVEKMVLTLEYADGEGENHGGYLRFGWGM
jgi:hypothetical protein